MMTLLIVSASLSLSAAFVPTSPLIDNSNRRFGLVRSSTMNDYMSYLSSGATMTAPTPRSPPQESKMAGDEETTQFFHAALSYFALDKLKAKGPRANADVGEPHDATRPLTLGKTSAGSWWCASGGWPSPALRTTTEVFYVLSGHGCLTDLDDLPHYFGPGDTVVLPKGWSGRWDVLEDIHKVWFVYDHPHVVEETSPIRAVVKHHAHLASSPSIYNKGPTKVESRSFAASTSFDTVNDKRTTECFHVLEGLFFLTNAEDGSARRCVAGDTVVLPKGWTGHWQVIEPVKTLWVTTIDEQ